MAAHSHLGASGAHRWIPCPGSVRMSRGWANEGSVYAREGSAAHFIGETALNEGHDAIHYLGFVVPEYPEIVIDESLLACVQEYLDEVRGWIAKYVEDTGLDDWELGVETRFDLGYVHPGMFGTSDANLFLPAWNMLIVFDYKHGWISVPVERNPQAMYYAVGAVHTKSNRPIDTIKLVIVQPRSGRSTFVKRWDCDREELEDFKATLGDYARRTEDPKAPLNPGEWCKFCPAAPTCRALVGKVKERLMAKKDPIDGLTLPNPDALNESELREIWDDCGMIESWVKNFKSFIHKRATEEGKLLVGTKLVEGRANRKWIDEADARKELKQLKLIGELDGEIFTAPELKSPAQIEDMLPKKFKDIIKHLWVKPRGGLTLAHDTDDRASAKVDAAKEFS